MDEEKIKKAVTMIIEAIGENPEREGLIDTPDRIFRMYREIFSGIDLDADTYLSRKFTVDYNDIVIEKDIQFYSMCEHHLLPFFGKAHIAYIPSGEVAGLSKLARTVDIYARRPQLQERMTKQIADAIIKNLNPKGVMVVLEAEHLCMTMRGVQKPGSKTTTILAKGLFKEDNNLKLQVLEMIKNV